MTELLLRVHDQVHPTDEFKTLRLTKRGDFIVTVPDGWTWGTREASNPAWRILSSDVPDAEALSWTVDGKLVDEKAVSYTVWKRKIMWLRCDLATGDFATWLANDARPSGNMPDRIVSGTHDVAAKDDLGRDVLVKAAYSYRVPLWRIAANDLRALVERKPEGPSRPMVAGVGYVVRPS